ncbi:helix-turn-helix domain-containing protein [Clostridium rectalis]|uniref:helix-turn-helix domain-containing protein n=1 Tax=Clostridium rectalis TaxID=2040295 RepID=UPI000F63CB9F|nr:helix-turn-helix transcriptional regulator [Clostridium rectalis]
MEILSTGEKIRRARIYKGYTLKYICGDKISVSKMSCIENNKVIPEDWILELVAEKLDLDVNYLKDDVKSQIKKNIGIIKSNKKSDYEQQLEYNLSYAEEYKYYKEAFSIMHMIFSFNIDSGNCEKLQVLIPKYYDLCLKSKSDDNQMTYYMDIARYLYNSQEFVQAAGYYNTIRTEAIKKDKNNILAKATFNECACYLMLEDYEKAYKVCKVLDNYIEYFQDDIKKADAYHMMAVLAIRGNIVEFSKFEKKSYDLYGDNDIHKSKAIFNYATAMFTVKMKEKGIEYINKALKCHPREKQNKIVSFMLMCVEELLKNNIIDEAEKVNDEVINYAINLDNMIYIEKAYHYKALLLGKKDELVSEEMYMNLSLDALLKFGSKKDIYKRYMEMGTMYYKMNNTSEAIKYFNLAINLHKKI